MDLKNVLKWEYLNDLLYILSGGLANAWLSKFDIWNRNFIFIDNYLLDGNNFLYIILYLSLSFVLGVFLRGLGGVLYKATHNVFPKLAEDDLNKIKVQPVSDASKYILQRSIARKNGHLIFMGFFFLAMILSICNKVSWYMTAALFVLFINAIRCTNDQLKELQKK